MLLDMSTNNLPPEYENNLFVKGNKYFVPRAGIIKIGLYIYIYIYIFLSFCCLSLNLIAKFCMQLAFNERFKNRFLKTTLQYYNHSETCLHNLRAWLTENVESSTLRFPTNQENLP